MSMAVLLTALLLPVTSLAALAVYRLYLHPLARFPGPKLAALSKWYEAYYEILKQGRFTFKIDELHDKYGPIVRITPEELHIRDSEFFDTLYVKHPKASRYEWMSGRFGNNGSTFTTAEPEIHKMRRSALTSLFSRRSILSFEDEVDQKMQLLCQGIAKTKREDGRELAISHGFEAYSGDVITQYSFGFSYDHLKSKDFEVNMEAAFMAVSKFGHTALQFPWMPMVLNQLPDSFVAWMNPPLQTLLQLKKDVRTTLEEITHNEKTGVAQPTHPTIFHSLLQSTLPPSEKSKDRLGDEAQTVLGAGVATTAWALTHAIYHLLASPTHLSTLRAELQTAIPDPDAPHAFAHTRLERLPFLSACVREATRLSIGSSMRSPRVLSEPLPFRSWVVPPGWAVSMSIRDVHFDEGVYEDAGAFAPQRWLPTEDGGAPRAKDGEPLDRYYVPFLKGVRMCLGMNLAYVEMYKALAAVVRLFELELFETDASDVDLAHDFALPSPKLDSKGVRVKVRAVEECAWTRGEA